MPLRIEGDPRCPAGWDQDAYDLLTGTWRTVIGPVHPDDARVAG